MTDNISARDNSNKFEHIVTRAFKMRMHYDKSWQKQELLKYKIIVSLDLSNTNLVPNDKIDVVINLRDLNISLLHIETEDKYREFLNTRSTSDPLVGEASYIITIESKLTEADCYNIRAGFFDTVLDEVVVNAENYLRKLLNFVALSELTISIRDSVSSRKQLLDTLECIVNRNISSEYTWTQSV